MKITIDVRPPRKGDATTLRFISTEQRAQLAPPVSEAEFSGKPSSLLHLRHESVLLVGLGERAKLDAARARTAAGTAAMFLKKIGRTRIVVSVEEWPQFIGPVLEGIILADYRFEQFKTSKTAALERVHLQVLADDLPAAKAAVARARAVAEATNACREIGNQPGNLLYPETLAARAVQLAKTHGLHVTILDGTATGTGVTGRLTATTTGSANGPRMIVLEHRGGPKHEAPLVFVGKAITFDSGGISIKPAANMEEMIFDKCGGMAVLGAMAAIADLKLKRNVVGIIASAENVLGPEAYRPGDILTTYDGQHIEIVNTDAEGRVVLADALAMARNDFKAAAIVDLATLTGACGVALGDSAAGLWDNDEALGCAVLAASERAGERLWRMPLFPEHEETIKSDVALIKNSGGRLGGACTAAAFLKAFVGATPWAHLDIAYTAHREKAQPHMARGATGFGVRTLVELAEKWTG